MSPKYVRKGISARNVRRAERKIKEDEEIREEEANDNSDGFFLSDRQTRALDTFKRTRLAQTQGDGILKSKKGAKRSLTDLLDEGDNVATVENSDGEVLDEDDDDENFLGAGLNETAGQKRVRLAQEYIAAIREETRLEQGDVDAAYLDKQIIAERLKGDVLEKQGKAFHLVAAKYLNAELTEENGSVQTIKSWRKPHQLSVTSLAVATLPINADGNFGTSETTNAANSVGAEDLFNSSSSAFTTKTFVFSASKDATIAKWDFDTGKLVRYTPGGIKPTAKARKTYGSKLDENTVGHNQSVLTLSASSNGRYLASGGFDKAIHVWDTITGEHIKEFKQHRDAVSGLVFRLDTQKNDLYSVSFDRTVKVWNVDALTYVETLFGHQDKISSIATLQKERCVTSGSQDRTARIWKIPEESQLVFRGSGAQKSAKEEMVVMDGSRIVKKEVYGKQDKNTGQTLDAVAMIDEDTFLTAGDNGSIALWSTTRKKPVYIKAKCHGPGSLKYPLTKNNPTPQYVGDVFETSTIDDTKKKNSNSFSQRYEKLSLATRGCSTGQAIPTCIVSLATLPYSDLFVSGGADGYIRLWKVSNDKKKFGLLTVAKIDGFVNDLKVFETHPQEPERGNASKVAKDAEAQAAIDAAKKKTKKTATVMDKLAIREALTSKKRKQIFILAAIGQEHKFGRWWKRSEAKNTIKLIKLDHALAQKNAS